VEPSAADFYFGNSVGGAGAAGSSLAVGFANTPIATAWAWQRVNQLSAISSRARGPRRIRPELWVEPPPISFCQILLDRIGWAGGGGGRGNCRERSSTRAVADARRPAT